MNRRVVLLTEIIAPYRIPVFNALSRIEGIHLHVIFLAETDPDMRGWLVYKNEIQFSYEVLPSFRRRLGKRNILLNRGLGAALRKYEPDVIVCGGYNYAASWQALAWARRNVVPFILWAESNVNDARRNNRLIEALKRLFIRKCEKFVVPGKASHSYLMSFNVSEESIFTAPNAVDNELLGNTAKLTRAESGKWRLKLKLPARFFLFVGRIVREKGVFDLLNAYCAMNPEVRKQVGLVFAGDGPARTELERSARNISDVMIQFPGFVQREELASYYALADAMILPTHTDPWGLAVNEAMACGLAIVCTDVAGCTADLVEDGWNGYVVCKKNVDQLSRVLEELAKNPDRSRAMGENSVARILQYTPQACAEGIAKAAFSCEPSPE